MVVRESGDRRLGLSPAPYELAGALDGSLTRDGLGVAEATRRLKDEVLAQCLRVDHPAFLAFVPSAPDPQSIFADQQVSAAAVYAGDWKEAAGALYAEQQVITLLAERAGFPSTATGTFVSGGSAGSLSALVTARHRWRTADPARAHDRAVVLASHDVHSSVAAACNVMDVELLLIPTDKNGCLTGELLAEFVDTLPPATRSRVMAVVASVGTTNAGAVDDLVAIGSIAQAHDWWCHVDGAYGLACLISDELRHLARGIERADSFIVDPHKWLFAPYDACALVYREPGYAKAAHGQRAGYLAALSRHADNDAFVDPGNLAFQLSRRARGLPLWFGLASHGTAFYAAQVEHGVMLARWTAAQIDAAEHLELLIEPVLSVVLFRRVSWDAAQYERWSTELFDRGIGFVVPTVADGQPALRMCFVNPETTLAHVGAILDTLL